MEGNRVQKSKHANLLIQSCNHVDVTVSTMYVCSVSVFSLFIRSSHYSYDIRGTKHVYK
jgi:hypothetical protein